MTSTRQQIISALATLLHTVPGVVTVAHWRKSPFKLADLPAVYIEAPEDRIASVVIGLHDHTLTLVLGLYLPRASAGAVVDDYLDGIMAAIGSNPTLGGLVNITRPRLITTDLLQTGDIIAAAAVVLEMEYRTAVWQL